MLRPFEREIVREIRVRPERPGAGGRSVSRKGAWIRGHLQDVGRDYPYSMWKRWKSFLEDAGLNIEAGKYQAFRTYIYVLRKLGLIRRAGGSPSTFGKKYYELNPEGINSPLWKNPFKAYGTVRNF